MLSSPPHATSTRVSTAVSVFLVLAAVDTVLVLLHIAATSRVLSDTRLTITRERGLAEFVQYIKAAGTSAMLAAVFRATRSRTALVWSAGLFAVFVDDAFALHERVGARVGPLLFPSGLGGLAAEHAAELVLLGGGAALFAGAAIGAAAREGARGRAITTILGGPVAILALFGAGVDALHSRVTDRTARRTLAVVEDGGEMLAMSAIVAISFALRAQVRASRSTWAASSGDVGFR